ncbi:Calcium permeable stress-gated cation channel 1 [Spathaspora sp. JA1]|nr:Calcium permeable stress-gated cation channel 1 [Spathaspora sp. JA1]
MGIKIFAILSVMAVCILSPLRFYFTGSYDKDSIEFKVMDSIYHGIAGQPPPDISDDFPPFLWVYPIFTYVFSIVVFYCLYDFTNQVLRTRQKYLASQNSITDRTIRLDGIPKQLQQRHRLKKFIEDLGIGNVVDVKLIYDWSPLEKLFTKRTELVDNLEYLYASLYTLDIDIYNKQKIPSVNPIFDSPIDGSTTDTVKDLIKQYSEELISLDQEIHIIQNKFDPNLSTIDVKQHNDFKQIPSAFITMDSVASAQMAAQTVLDPRVYKLIVNLAPAPKDIIWGNLKLTYYQKLFKSYLITFLIVLSYGFIIFLVVPLTSLLDLKTITKFWPALGEFIGQSEWLTTFVTGILPPLLFTILNLSFPYFYRWLSQYQGHSSNSDIELSTLSKNFFFIFFNLFLIYVAAGTFWDYISYISDTTKIAVQLATSLKRMALFYVDLILLQGLTMFPVKLLQVSDFLILNILGKFLPRMFLRTPRNYRTYYYTPQVFDFGIHLPQHILIFMIILIYSVVSTKIVTCGLVYFIMGLLVYKYQLVYNFVHPPHSTGKVWPMIFRRVMLGLIIFQLFMCGTLALESAILLSIMCAPLIPVTLFICWNFEKYYVPLNTFIALRAILSPYDYDKVFDDDQSFNSDEEESALEIRSSEAGPIDESSFLLEEHARIRRRKSTIDEEREEFTNYTYPYLIDPLDGPWVGFSGDQVSMVEYKVNSSSLEQGSRVDPLVGESETIVKKKLVVSEWE